MNKRLRAVVGVLAVGALAACQDLTVPNTNEPDRARAQSNPEDVEALVLGGWSNYWGRTHSSSSSARSMPNIADEFTATYANNASLELSSEPRVALNNNPLAAAHSIPRFQWEDWLSMLSNANDGLAAIDGGLVIEVNGEDRTERTRIFAKYLQGLSLGYLGMLFDQSYVVTEDTDITDPENLEYKPYPEVLDAAVASLEEVIALAGASPPFEIPESVINGYPISRDYLIQLAHSYIVRFRVLGARTVAEREALDWNEILQHVGAGITTDHNVLLQDQVLESTLLFYAQNNGSFQMKADYYAIGWSDVSGAFQDWLATPLEERQKFLIVTPDRRITGDTPDSDGLYYEYFEAELFRPERGTYHFTWYQWNRPGGRYQDGPWAIYPVRELKLYEAEARYRLGQMAQAAAIVNESRAVGQLPDVTASGVPQAADCVPRMADGSCGDLLWALYYERLIELAGVDALRTYLDKRGFGQLTRDTFEQLPVPARELENLGLPVYTFGGPGGTSSAPGGEAG